ncbi:MAG TPA: carboxypeptidase-like regulatory domain-containing protein [Acidobacteriaceae bacterium]|nr:carboxypeptidase-like regulatory domain-containing protein [Acidobacteriaceae bacterium]
MRGPLVAVFSMSLLPLLAAAQSAPATTATQTAQDPGSAVGHVTCGDTQRPARIAQVRLIPVGNITRADATGPKVKMPEVQEDAEVGAGVNPVETDMDGNFSIHNLKPGRYYVRVDLQGYVAPLLTFGAKELQQPDEATRERIARELQTVDIQPHTETRVDVTVQRGASVGGTVRFDDGTPAAGLNVMLFRQAATGKWEGTHLQGRGYGSTDGRGQYLFESLPPGIYTVKADLALKEFSQATMPMPTNGVQMHVTMSRTTFELPVYFGNALRQRDASPIKVEGSANYDGNDISLPLSKLHHVSGALVAGDGHSLNSGKVFLRYPDDDTEVASVGVNREDRQFHFPYVPEGSYKLEVDEARDVTEIEVPNAPGVTPKTRLEDKTVKRYGKLEQALVVQSDVEGVVATVPEMGKTASAAIPTQTSE